MINGINQIANRVQETGECLGLELEAFCFCHSISNNDHNKHKLNK